MAGESTNMFEIEFIREIVYNYTAHENIVEKNNDDHSIKINQTLLKQCGETQYQKLFSEWLVVEKKNMLSTLMLQF